MKTIRTGLKTQVKRLHSLREASWIESNSVGLHCSQRGEEGALFSCLRNYSSYNKTHTFSFDTVVICLMLISQEFLCLPEGICPTREKSMERMLQPSFQRTQQLSNKEKNKTFSPSAKGLALLPCKHKTKLEQKFSRFEKTKENTKRLTISGNSKWSTPETELVCAGRRRGGGNVGDHLYYFALKKKRHKT